MVASSGTGVIARAYSLIKIVARVSIGAKICGRPAIDREFGTIDFLTFLDLRALPAILRSHFLR